MNKVKGIIYVLIGISMGYLFYIYLFTNNGYGMMNHHYGYYDRYSGFSYYLNLGLVVLACSIIIIGIIILLSKMKISRNDAIPILEERLSKGEISIEEFQKIKRSINLK